MLRDWCWVGTFIKRVGYWRIFADDIAAIALWSPVTLELAHVSLTFHSTIWTILLLNSRQNILAITGDLSDLKCDALACSASADSLRVAGRCSLALERLSPASPQAPTPCDMVEERSTSLQLLPQSRRVRWVWTPRSSRSRVMHQASCSPSSPLPSSAFTPVHPPAMSHSFSRNLTAVPLPFWSISDRIQYRWCLVSRPGSRGRS